MFNNLNRFFLIVFNRFIYSSYCLDDKLLNFLLFFPFRSKKSNFIKFLVKFSLNFSALPGYLLFFSCSTFAPRCFINFFFLVSRESKREKKNEINFNFCPHVHKVIFALKQSPWKNIIDEIKATEEKRRAKNLLENIGLYAITIFSVHWECRQQ